MNEIGPLHRRLADFVGDWEGDGEIFPNPWGPAGRGHGKWSIRLAAAGFSLIQDFAEVREGGHRFDAHGVLTVAPEVGDYVWFWFDSYGFPPLHPARGNWQGSSLMLEKTTPRGIGRSVFELHHDGFDYRVESKLNGEEHFAPVMAGHFAKIA